MQQWQITELESGLSLLEILGLRLPAAPTGFLRKLCASRRASCDDRPLLATDTLTRGQTLAIRESERLMELVRASRLPPETILFEDPLTLVIDKPAGLAVHHAQGHVDNLQARVQAHLKLRGAPFRTAPAHRLDVGTSGPVLFGKGQQAIRRLGQQFMDGAVTKRYIALVEGSPDNGGTLTLPVSAHGKLKPACTEYRCLARTPRTALLELDLKTGRLHQIRRQLAARGWPIYGDHRYGGQPLPGLARPFLHCHQLFFSSLLDGTGRQIVSPLPVALDAILRQLGVHSAVDENGGFSTQGQRDSL